MLSTTGEFRGVIRTGLIKIISNGFVKQDSFFIEFIQSILIRFWSGKFAEILQNHENRKFQDICTYILFFIYIIYTSYEIYKYYTNKSLFDDKKKKNNIYILIISNIFLIISFFILIKNNSSSNISLINKL